MVERNLKKDRTGQRQITEYEELKIQGNSGGHLVHHPTRSTVKYHRFLRTVPGPLLKISWNGHSTTSPGTFCQRSVTLTQEMFFPMHKCSLPYFSLHLSSLAFLLKTATQSQSLPQPEQRGTWPPQT